MKEICLTRGKVALVDDEDFERVSVFKWCAVLRLHVWYSARKTPAEEGGKVIYMHRFILNAPAGIMVDHKDRNGLNNTRSNLRLCSASQNNANARLPSTNRSGFRGVYWDCAYGVWAAQIKVNRRKKHLGRFDDVQDAARAYDRAAIVAFGDFAHLNFPSESGKEIDNAK